MNAYRDFLEGRLTRNSLSCNAFGSICSVLWAFLILIFDQKDGCRNKYL